MRMLLALIVIAVTMGVASTAQGSLRLPHKPWNEMTKSMKINYLKRQIHHDRSIIRFAKNHRELQSVSLRHAEKWAHTSLRIAQASLKKLTAIAVHASSEIISALLCIHRYEGSWTDPNSPYWGGLQMDMNFQSTYGPEFLKEYGTADHWPIAAQLEAAVRAVHVRGFSPWPNTARYCGLL